MIKVTVCKTNNKITAFEISGHADFGPYGYDLVCAGVSAVSFGAVNAVMELCHIDLKIKQNTGGYLHVSIPDMLDDQTNRNVQLLFDAMLISLKTIEHEYKQFIKIYSK